MSINGRYWKNGAKYNRWHMHTEQFNTSILYQWYRSELLDSAWLILNDIVFTSYLIYIHIYVRSSRANGRTRTRIMYSSTLMKQNQNEDIWSNQKHRHQTHLHDSDYSLTFRSQNISNISTKIVWDIYIFFSLFLFSSLFSTSHFQWATLCILNPMWWLMVS